MTQLATKKNVILPFGHHHIIFQADEERGDWSVSLKLSSLYKNKFSDQIKECFSARSQAFFSTKSYLVVDHKHGPGVYLVRNVKPTKKYLLFKALFEELVEEADDFKDLLCLT